MQKYLLTLFIGLGFGLFLFPTLVHAVITNPPISCSTPGVVEENVGTTNITFKLFDSSNSIVSVDYAITGGNAQNNGVDFTLASGTAIFPIGVKSIDVPMIIINNSTWDIDPRSIEISMSNPVNGIIRSNCKMSIIDNSDQPTVNFSSSSGTGVESIGTVNAKIVLSNPASKTLGYVLVNNYNRTDTAKFGSDFSDSVANVLKIPAGSIEALFPVRIINDSEIEGTEAFQYNLISQDWGALKLGSNPSFSYTILDDDPSTIAINNLFGQQQFVGNVRKDDFFALLDSKKTVVPGPTGYRGTWWAKRLVFPSAVPATTNVFIPLSPNPRGVISVYNRVGKLLQTVKPAGSYITKGGVGDIVVEPSSTTAILAFAHLNSTTVKLYKVTTTGLTELKQVVINRKGSKADTIIGFRKMYGKDYGLVTMVKGLPSTLQIWKYNPTSNSFSLDTSKQTRAKVVVKGNVISVK